MNALTPLSGTSSAVDSEHATPKGDYLPVAPANRVQRYFGFIRKYWWISALALLLAIAGGAWFIRSAPPVYVSSAAMWETEKLHLVEGALFTDDAQTYIGTQIELLKSGRMWQAAIERLRAAGTNTVPLGPDGLPLPISLKFKEAPRSTVFSISASSADPAFSRNFLDTLMAEYLEYKKVVRKSVSGETAASISTQVESAERDLKSAQDALTSFERTNNLAIMQEEGTVAGGYLTRLQTELSDLRLEDALLRARSAEQEAGAQSYDFSGRDPVDFMKALNATGPQAANNTRLTPYQEVAVLKTQRERLSRYLRPRHPKIAALDAQIANGERLLELFRSQSKEQLAASQAAVKMKVTSVLASIKEWDAKVVQSNERIAEAERLKVNVGRAQSVYDRLATLLQNVDITRNTDLETLAVLEPASIAKRSYRRDVLVSVLAVVLGLLGGAASILLIESRDDRFTSVSDVNATLGDAVVGLLPEVANGTDSVCLLELDDCRHGYLESYRNLRSALHFFSPHGARPKTLLISSAIPGEGKSTIAVNLGRTLAMSGSRVLLVDGDLRKGHLYRALKLKNDPGLAELLRGTCEAKNVFQEDPLSGLAFISTGVRPRNPGDLFLKSDFQQHLERWRQQFDYVLIDSSPLFAADDASCLAPHMDGTLFVVRQGYSSARAVSKAIDLLGQRQARVLGVVFNGANASARCNEYYKYADYGVTATA